MRVVYGQGKNRKTVKTDPAVRKINGQLFRLLICLALFLAVYISKGVFPRQMAQTGPKLLQVIRVNTNFEQALYALGQTLAQEESVLGGIGDFCVEVFAPRAEAMAEQGTGALLEQVSRLGNAAGQAVGQVAERAEGMDVPVSDAVQYRPGDVVKESVGGADALPEGYDPRWLYLGDEETVTPVMGRVTSSFGYRDHPTKGRHAVHNGVDIGADSGQSVSAFLSGVVSEVGESTDFGKYLYIEHEHGVRTFYAHCSVVCVERGQRVAAGEQVARVGSTGQSTGPHLHFEVEMNGVRLDPLHYIAPAGT